MQKRVDILGSCVTRDAFEYSNAKEYVPVPYFARSSLISVISSPIDILKEGIELESAFQQKTVHNDLNKIFLTHIATSDSLFLLIDLIDERFDVLRYRDTYLTCSDEYKRSNLPKILKTEALEKNEDYYRMWEDAAKIFIEQIRHRKPKSVILHRAFWKKKYRDIDGTVKEFPDQEKIDKNNRILERMYSFIESISGDLLVSIQLSDDYVSDSNHRWGLSPFHYEDRYYVDFIERVKKIDMKRKTVLEKF